MTYTVPTAKGAPTMHTSYIGKREAIEADAALFFGARSLDRKATSS